MALSDITLGHLFLHPARQLNDISETSAATVGSVVKAYMDKNLNTNNAKPDNMAVTFYAFSQMIGYLTSIYDRSEPMAEEDAEILKRYFTFMDAEGTRAAIYLLLICIRECRHTHSNPVTDLKISKEVSKAAVDWIRKYKSGENYTSLWTDPPKCTFGQLVTAIRRFFYEQSYNSGYGGPKWGAVTDCIESFIYGKTSAEVMMDTNWTLAHNNGPIFNKGMLYHDYDHKLLNILDVQRAGMILQGIIEDHVVLSYATTSTLRNLCHAFVKRHQKSIGAAYIDWYQVENLGAVNDCVYYQSLQKKKYGPSPYAKWEGPTAGVEPETYYEVDTNTLLKVVPSKRPQVEEKSIPAAVIPEVEAKLLDYLLDGGSANLTAFAKHIGMTSDKVLSIEHSKEPPKKLKILLPKKAS
jgi:hypothetical protein